MGAKQLALAAIGQSASQNARLVSANVRAMEAALAGLCELSAVSILGMHHALMDGTSTGVAPGEWRDELVWIGTTSRTPVGGSYIAPQSEHVGPAIEDLVRFTRRGNIPAIAQIAVAHAQFETIHPFPDGNGRTGRALIHTLLKNKGVVTSTTAPLPAGLLRDTQAYVHALQANREGGAGPIIESFCHASRFAGHEGAELVDELYVHVLESQERLDRASVRADAAARKVVPLLVSNPVIDAAS